MNTSPLCIGFLDENGNDDYHSLMMEGMFEAAARHGARLVRISHFMANDTVRDPLQVRLVRDHAHAFGFDGLMFLGFGRVAVEQRDGTLQQRFPGMPLMCVGTRHPEIPSAWFDGTPYVEELLLHLIRRHGCRRVAFIAPALPDDRAEVYQRVMRQRGLSDPALLVEAALLEGLTIPERGMRAVEILLKERNAAPDAIMSMYNAETQGVIRALAAHGCRVPEDMAVTSYEDGAPARFETPAYTTVLYPWKEMGRSACDLFLTQLERDRKPERDTAVAQMSGLAAVMGISTRTSSVLPRELLVPGRALYRASCGCTPAETLPVVDDGMHGKSLPDMSEIELSRLADRVRNTLQHNLPGNLPDLRMLLRGLRDGLLSGNRRIFLQAMESQCDVFPERGSDAEPILDTLREAVMPHVDRVPTLLLATEDMFMQSQALLAERDLRLWGDRERVERRMNRSVEDVGQLIIGQYDLDGLSNAVAQGIRLLDIPDCLFVVTTGNLEADPFGQMKVLLRVENGNREETPDTHVASASVWIRRFLESPSAPTRIISHLLHVRNACMGFVLYGAGPMDERIYQALSRHVGTALSGIFLTEKLEHSFSRLVGQAHREGMSQAASRVLHDLQQTLEDMNTSAGQLGELLSAYPVEALSGMAEVLAGAEETGRLRPETTDASALVRQLQAMETSLRAHDMAVQPILERLHSDVGHLRETLSGQQGGG